MTRFAATAALICILASACLGSSSAPSPGSLAGPRPPALIRLTVTYSAGVPVESRRRLRAACPASARCRAERLAGTTPQLWVQAVRRTLDCRPASGAYADPGRACAALADLRRLLHEPHQLVCRCPLQPGIAPFALGRVDGIAARIPLDFCTYCGLSGHPQRDLAILLPGGG